MLETLDFPRAFRLMGPILLKGIGVVLEVTLLGFLLAVVLSLMIAIFRLSRHKILSGFLTCVLEIVRGTPLLVQLLYIYYVVPLLLTMALNAVGFPDYRLTLPAVSAGVLGLGINYGCYLSEVIRSAILTIDTGQGEAAQALGFSESQALLRIILPQAMRNAVPIFGNYLVMMIKDSSLLSYVTVNELLLRTQSFAAQTFLTIEAYSLLALVYLAISFPLSRLVKYLEKSMSLSGGVYR